MKDKMATMFQSNCSLTFGRSEVVSRNLRATAAVRLPPELRPETSRHINTFTRSFTGILLLFSLQTVVCYCYGV